MFLRSLAGRIGHSTTVSMFREDRLLRWGFALLGLAMSLPVFMTPFLPLVDMGSNIGAAGLLDDVLRGRETVAHHYRINWFPVPYWTGYSIMAFFDALFGPFVGHKALVVIDVLLLPLGTMRLLRALGRSPRLGLWAFLLSWDINLHWGWVSFQLGMGLALFTLARLFEARSLRECVKLVPLSALVALSHAHAVVLLGAAGGLLALLRLRSWRHTMHTLVALSGAGLLVLPWLFSRFVTGERARSRGFSADFPGLPDRINKFFRYTLDVVPGTLGETVTGLALLLLIVSPALLSLLPRRDVSGQETGKSLVIFTAALVLYLGLPFAIHSPVAHWWNHPRFASYVLIGLLLLPAPDLTGRRALALLPGVILVLGFAFVTARQFREYGSYTRPYLRIIAAIPQGSRFLPLDYEIRHPSIRYGAVGQLHGFAAAATASFDPHLFDEGNNPLLFRRENKLPTPSWRKLETFSLDAHGKHYDFIIVHPLSRDVLNGAAGVRRVLEAGDWRLYAVERRTP